MPKRILDKEGLRQFEDWYGNNAAVHCPVCGKVFIVSRFINKGQRKCPNCQKTTAGITTSRVTLEWPNTENEPRVYTRKELESSGRLDKFVWLVSQGGAVDYRSIEAKLSRAETVALIEYGEKVIAAAAIKSPSSQYAKTLREKTGYRLFDDMPELGYVAVACEWRGLGLSTKVVQELLSTKTDWGVFATTSSPQMKNTLRHHNLWQVGNQYPDKHGKSQLSLWVRDDKAGVKAFLDAEEQAVVDKAIARAEQSGYPMELRYCFRNAQAVSVADYSQGSAELVYHEGYVPSPRGMAPHAWLTIHGKIIEVTYAVAEHYDRLFAKLVYVPAGIVPAETVRHHFSEGKRRGGYVSILGLRIAP